MMQTECGLLLKGQSYVILTVEEEIFDEWGMVPTFLLDKKLCYGVEVVELK